MRIFSVLFLAMFLGFLGIANAAPSAQHKHGSDHGQVSPQTGEFVYGYSEKEIEAFRQFLTSRRLGLLDKAVKQASCLRNSELRQKAYAVMVYEFVRIGDMKRAEEFAAKVANHELKWYAYYALAVEGYAPRGDMIEALVSAEISMTALADSASIATEDRAGSEMLTAKRNKLLVDMAVSRIETGDYGEEVWMVLSKIDDKPYYWLMAVEQSVLRLYDQPRAERFLAFMGYEPCEPSEKELTMLDIPTEGMISDIPVVYYRNASRDILIAVQYGVDAETGKPSVFIVYSLLTLNQALDRKNTQ